MINWIKTYEFLGYPPSNNLETEIYNKSQEVRSAWKKGNPKNPNEYPFLKKITAYPLEFLQQYFQDRVGNPQ